jgi:hypothetical protein
MGACASAPLTGIDAGEAYGARAWVPPAGGGAGAPFGAAAAARPPPQAYTTTADLGLGGGRLPGLLADLGPIDEERSLALPASPARNAGGAPTPRGQPGACAAAGLLGAAGSGAVDVAASALFSAPDGSPHPPRNWTQGELIGQGAFGSVYLGLDNDTGQLMAVKQVGG